MTNIFKQAKQLLDTKKCSEMSKHELDIVNCAIIPLNKLPAFSDMTIEEGLEKMAKILEEARKGKPRCKRHS